MTSAISPPGGPALAGASPAQLHRTAEDFTAVALNELLAPMFATIGNDGPFDGGAGEQTFRPLLVAEMAKHLAHAGGLGLTDTVYRQMLRLQENAR